MKVCTRNVRINPDKSPNYDTERHDSKSKYYQNKYDDYRNDYENLKNKYNHCKEEYTDLRKKYKDAYFEKAFPSAALIFTAGACSEALTGSGIGWAVLVIILIV
jgi:hypothetical protein